MPDIDEGLSIIKTTWSPLLQNYHIWLRDLGGNGKIATVTSVDTTLNSVFIVFEYEDSTLYALNTYHVRINKEEYDTIINASEELSSSDSVLLETWVDGSLLFVKSNKFLKVGHLGRGNNEHDKFDSLLNEVIIDKILRVKRER